ncbi:MAG: NTP transferase domain-containing protein [Actinomycetota bacterium]|nr:NTP transferase domain-containing protein [Actinomycetota bacterium]
MPRVAGLVLAAGAGRRYGMPKALVPYEGRLLVERACHLVAAVCDPVVVVVGAAADEVRSRAKLGDAVVVLNPDWDSGMGSSLRTGLAALRALSGGLRENHQSADPAPGPGGLRGNHQSGSGPDLVDAVLVHLVDLPGMTVAALRRVAAAATPEVLAVATYGGVRGHPVLVGRTHWAGVAASAIGDQGARGYLAAHEVTEIECSDVADPADLDYPPT